MSPQVTLPIETSPAVDGSPWGVVVLILVALLVVAAVWMLTRLAERETSRRPRDD